MVDNINIVGTSTTSNQKDLNPEDLAPNNYLTIIWKDVTMSDLLKQLDIDEKSALEYTNQINNAIDTAIAKNNVSYAGQNKYINIEAIGKYIAQNSISSNTQRRVANALIGMASGGKEKLTSTATNLCVNVFGDIADKTARKLGLTDPHEVFSQITGQNALNVMGTLGKQTKDFLDDCIAKITGDKKTNLVSNEGSKETPKQYTGLLLGLTTSDTESYEITIPRKKVEDGSDYTTHLLPQPFKKEFSVKLTNKILTPEFSQLNEINAIEYTKDKLIEIAQSRTLFDIYIRLSADKIYKRSNVVFSSLSFTKDEGSGNSYTATFTIEPVNNFKTKVFVSNKKYATGSKGTGQNGSGTDRPQADNTTDGKSLKVGYITNAKAFTQKVLRTKEAVLKDNISSGNWVYNSSIGTPNDITFALDSAVSSYDGVPVLEKDILYSVSTGTSLQGFKTVRVAIGIKDGHVDKATGRVYRKNGSYYQLSKGE